MEHDDNDQLHRLLQEWKTPPLSAALDKRVLSLRRSPWSFLLHGSVRVPMPVMSGLILMLAFGVWRYAKPVEHFISCVGANPAATCQSNARCAQPR